MLQEMGYDQQMKRGFNFWSMTAFCLTGLGLLPSLGGETLSICRDLALLVAYNVQAQSGTVWVSLGFCQ